MNLSVPCQLPIYTTDLYGKIKTHLHPCVLERCNKPFELVHTDLVLFDSISFGNTKHMFLFVNNYTCFAWAYFTSSKDISAVSPLIEGFINIVLAQFNTVIKQWRTDGGTGKFINSIVTKINCYYKILY
jgi:hypothetical protein